MPKYTVSDPNRILRRANYCILALAVIINVYTFSAPYIPKFYAWTDSFRGQQDHLQRLLNKPVPLTVKQAGRTTSPLSNQVIVPAMLTQTPITEGASPKSVRDKGVWRWPSSSTPDKAGNTVLLGSRFTYGEPRGVFYFADRLHAKSNFEVIWNHRVYHYTVIDIHKTKSNDSSPLKPSAFPTVTLYTTASLLSPGSYLAITGRLDTQQ